MQDASVKRRDFIKMGLAAGAVGAAAMAFPRFSLAKVKAVKLSEVMELTPEQMAQKSSLVMESWKYLNQSADGISDPDLKAKVKGILANPAPTFVEKIRDDNDRKSLYRELKAQGLISDKRMDLAKFLPPVKNPHKSPHPFFAAPGSGYASHHSYPGGVATHTAANVMISQAIYDSYQNVYGYKLNRDWVIASQLLHDLHKPWVFQWQPHGESRTELSLAGTGEHHTYSVAESLYRGLPAGMCVAQACAHNHPGWPKDEAGPVEWIKAACILQGKDVVKAGMLAQGGKTLPLPRRMENFVCHLGDHDWILTVPAAKWMIPVLQKIAAQEYKMSDKQLKGREFNQFRNYVFSQATIMTLYNLYSTRGQQALLKTVTRIVAPA